MSVQPRRIVVLGAPGTGAAELQRQLHTALAARPEFLLADDTQPLAAHDFALLMGLDQPHAEPSRQAHQDSALREQLQTLGLPYRVVYGAGPTRLVNALLALGLAPPDAGAQQTREQAQFDLNRGRTPWSCEKCSDPECEHKLFTGLLLRP
jgi:HTH-type transcriptional repressor of NAD biosynthesis genes